MNRLLNPEEEQLIRWMLEHGAPEAQGFLSQLKKARATTWRCGCGCASIDLCIEGLPAPSGGLHILADFIFSGDDDLSGAFVFEQNGVLAGLELYGLTGEAPKTLPLPGSLRTFSK